ncbi:MFS general substrate transporter [Hymenopellis radicata]|nr:MFS general substrate transporter [Hymenopellis radicata]
MTNRNDNEEAAPLLANTPGGKHNAVYDRFSSKKKNLIVALVSWCGLMPLFASGSFFPTIPDIAKDLNTTGSVVSIAISLSVLAAALGALIASSYSSFYGRRPIYLFGLPLLSIGSLLVGLAPSVPVLMTARFIQAFGASPGLSVGAGVVGDIYRLEERGGAMGIFFAACLLGPAIAPFCGGVIAHLASWRVMQFILAGAGFLGFICIFLFFPETSHPGMRGIDKLRGTRQIEDQGGSLKEKHSVWVWVNPLRPLWLLRSPNLLAVTIAGLAVLLTNYVLLTPLPYVFAARYGITNQAYIGLCFLPIGMGNLIGAPLAGFVSDRLVSSYRTHRGGTWYPEDRLRGTLIGAGVFVPLSVLGSGLLSDPRLVWLFGHGKAGFIGNLICLFFNGMGVDLVLSPSAAYGVDILHERSAESMAANNGLRSFLLSILIAGIIPLVETAGVAVTSAIAAAGAWSLGFGLLWLTIRYGERMRAWVDVGYSTEESN